MQGRLARAVERIEEADRLARETASTYALVTATAFAAMVHESRRDVAAVRERASAALAIASEHGFPQWVGLAMVLRGWAEVAAGGGDGGLDEMREGLAAWERTGTAIGRTYLLALLADGYARAERIDEGLDTIVQGMATLEESGERLVEPELHRLRGELLARRHGADRGVPEHCFAEAMATARRRGAKLLELRAATSLARSWMARGRRGDARRVLAAVCRSFPDPDGVDVATARAVLAQASVRPKRG
jgi:predicted ATPase